MAQAQLVADGQTNILDGAITNIASDITIGTNGSYTLLLLTNSATITNTGNAVIGANASATSNGAILTGTGVAWDCGASFYVGYEGALNELQILNGGLLNSDGMTIGARLSASNNLLLVSGVGSRCAVDFGLLVGSSGGSFNRLVVTNGGKLSSDIGYVGFGGSNNAASVADPGASWTNDTTLYVGYNGYNSSLTVTNGGVLQSGSSRIGRYSFSGNNFTLISDPGSLWRSSGSFYCGDEGGSNTLVVANAGRLICSLEFDVGRVGSANVLLVTNGGIVVANESACLACTASSTNNSAVVSGAGSTWTNRYNLDVGSYSSFNHLVVSNGGRIFAYDGAVGLGMGGNNNDVVVSGPGSLWTNLSLFTVGGGGNSNQLTVLDGGAVLNSTGYIGGNSDNFYGSNNLVFVSGSGSWWINQSRLYAGYNGSRNQLIVSGNGTVRASTCYVGFVSTSSNNVVTINGGNIIATNQTSTGVVDVRRGTLTQTDGLLVTDLLLLTNGSKSRLNLNGGRLQTRNTLVTNGSPFTVGDGVSPATYELLGDGTHSFANGLVITNNGHLTGNGTILGNVSVVGGGAVSPGTSVGQLAINGSLTLDSGSTTCVELDEATGTNDNFIGLANVIYGGTLQLTNLNGSLSSGNSFKLFSAINYSGMFNSLSPPSPSPTLKWNTNQLNVDGTLRIFSVPTPPPAVAVVSLSSGNITISASNGIPYDLCYLLTSTNVALPVAEWILCATNRFDSVGNVNFTNVIAFSDAKRFFRLAVE